MRHIFPAVVKGNSELHCNVLLLPVVLIRAEEEIDRLTSVRSNEYDGKVKPMMELKVTGKLTEEAFWKAGCFYNFHLGRRTPSCHFGIMRILSCVVRSFSHHIHTKLSYHIMLLVLLPTYLSFSVLEYLRLYW
jgi:hypothetical protein